MHQTSSRRPRVVALACATGLILAAGQPPVNAQTAIEVPGRYELREFAREPMIMNPVGISAAEDGSVYVAETRRRKSSNLDIRANADWLNDELSFKSVAEKEAFYLRTLSSERSAENARRVPDHNADGLHDFRDLTVHSELIHRLVDEDGDGIADKSTLFAEDFRTMLTGVAAGVHAEGDRVFATIAPNVWMLRDTNGDGISDERKAIATGFGVHVAYAGHNLHGPIMGPDGRLYWTVGDNGSDLAPNEGALFRSDPDGGDVELIARGLRNAQEVVFDKYGNIFTGDNDGDFGDRERWYHIVEGGDYGWRTHWQYQVGRQWGAEPHTYSLWNAEKLWHLPFPGQAAWIIPATAHIAAGPCGMAYYPGTGFGPEMDDHFFLAHFTGGAGSSKIHAYTVEPNGASYRLTKDEPFITNVTATGVDFSPDGSRLYFSEWTGGWSLGTEGRVHYLRDPKLADSIVIAETNRVLAEGGARRSSEELAALLAHANMNVRRMAQFELVRRGAPSVPLLQETAHSSGSQLARIHAMWGLEQIHRRDGESLLGIVDLLNDSDAEIRAQAAKMMGEGKIESAESRLIALLDDASARAQFQAAMALGKLRSSAAFQPVVELLASNGTKDLFLRHAGIMFLTWLNAPERIVALASHPSTDVRLAAAVALRKLERPEVSAFLGDSDELVVIEAARAINDVPIPAPIDELAGLVDGIDSADEPLLRRVLNANFRIGGEVNAERLIAFATNDEAPDEMRLESLRMLAEWESPSPRDRVSGAWLPVETNARYVEGIADRLRERYAGIVRGSSDFQAEATRILGRMNIKAEPASLIETAVNRDLEPSVRVSAMELLADNASQISDAQLETLLADSDLDIYAAAIALGARARPDAVLASIRAALNSPNGRRAQIAIQGLAAIDNEDAETMIIGAFNRFLEGSLPPEIGLDVVSAARGSKDPVTLKAVEAWETRHQSGDPTERYLIALRGGNAEKGRSVFYEKTELQCLRCHKIESTDDTGLMDAGPNLAGIGGRKSREYILQSIIAPNAAFADGYEQAFVTMNDGRLLMGRVLERSAEHLVLQVAGAVDEFSDEPAPPTRETIRLSQVRSIEKGVSGMPEGLVTLMSLHELRDLVEFLATQNQ